MRLGDAGRSAQFIVHHLQEKEDSMNQKLALLMFAIGLGAASAPALAASCQSYCVAAYRSCLAAGVDIATCSEENDACFANC